MYSYDTNDGDTFITLLLFYFPVAPQIQFFDKQRNCLREVLCSKYKDVRLYYNIGVLGPPSLSPRVCVCVCVCG